MLFKDLNLQIDETTQEIEYKGNKIHIKNYLPINDKYDIILLALEKSENYEIKQVYDRVKLRMFVNLYIVYLYTDLEFDDKERDNADETYDKLVSCGLMDNILDTIPEKELSAILKVLKEELETREKALTSVGFVLNRLIDDLPNQAAAAADIVDNFDKDKYSEVVEFAKSIGAKDISS